MPLIFVFPTLHAATESEWLGTVFTDADRATPTPVTVLTEPCAARN